MNDQTPTSDLENLSANSLETKKVPTPEENLDSKLLNLREKKVLAPQLESSIVRAIGDGAKDSRYDLKDKPVVKRIMAAMGQGPAHLVEPGNSEVSKGITLAINEIHNGRGIPESEFNYDYRNTASGALEKLKGSSQEAIDAAAVTLMADNAPAAALEIISKNATGNNGFDRFIGSIRTVLDTSTKNQLDHFDAVLAAVGNDEVVGITKRDLTDDKEVMSSDFTTIRDESISRLKEKSSERARGQVEVDLNYGPSSDFTGSSDTDSLKKDFSNWIVYSYDSAPLASKISERAREVSKIQLKNDVQREIFTACFPEAELASVYELAAMTSAVTKENPVFEPGKSDFCGKGMSRSQELSLVEGNPRLEELLKDPNKIQLKDLESIINSGKYGATVLEKQFSKHPDSTIKIMQRAILVAEVFSALYGQPKINSDLQADFVGSGAVNEFKATYQNFNPDFQAKVKDAKIVYPDGTSKTFGEVSKEHIDRIATRVKEIADNKEKNLAVAQENLRKSALSVLSERLDYNTALPTIQEAKILAKNTADQNLKDAKNDLQRNQNTLTHLQNQTPRGLNPLTWGNPSSEQIASDQKRISEAIERRKVMIQEFESVYKKADKAVIDLGAVSSIKNTAERSKKATDYLKTGVWQPNR